MIRSGYTALWDFRFNVSNKTKIKIVVLFCLAGLPALGLAAGERPEVSGADVYVAGGIIMSDLRCGGLFSEEIIGTVQSGLPAVVELLYVVTNRDDKTVKRGIHSYELYYDVWEDVYSIGRSDSSSCYSSFEAMSGAVEALRGVSIIRLQRLDTGAEYSISFSIAVHPLRGTEREKLEGWVGDTVGGRESGAWHEQVLNLNELIKRFFSRGKETSKRSEWFRTGFFSPRDLPGTKRDTGRRDGGAWMILASLSRSGYNAEVRHVD
jgi:hypothetical protein